MADRLTFPVTIPAARKVLMPRSAEAELGLTLHHNGASSQQAVSQPSRVDSLKRCKRFTPNPAPLTHHPQHLQGYLAYGEQPPLGHP